MVKKVLVLLMLGFPGLVFAQSSIKIADGGPVVNTDKGFSIVPPVGWEVIEDYPNTSLVAQPPFREGMKYQRTIQVVARNKPIEIGPQMAEAYGQKIIRRFGRSSANIEGYRIRNFLPVTLRDGNEGILYYAEFSLDGVELMQSHMLVASRTRHYLVSFTDLAEHFESGEGSKDFLSVAWDCMISFKVDAIPGFRMSREVKSLIGGGLALFALIVFWFFRYRKRSAIKKYQDMVVMEGTDEVVAGQKNQAGQRAPMPPSSAFEAAGEVPPSGRVEHGKHSETFAAEDEDDDGGIDELDFDDNGEKAG